MSEDIRAMQAEQAERIERAQESVDRLGEVLDEPLDLREVMVKATMERVGCDREEAERIVDRVADRL